MRKNIAIAVCTLLGCLGRLPSPTASASAQAPLQPLNPVSISGPVTQFDPASCGGKGLLTIAGLNIPIDGISLGFGADRVVVLPNGGLGQAIVAAEPFEVIGTNRRVNAYLTPSGRMQAWISTAGTTQRIVDMTGPVQAVSPTRVTISGLSFQVAPGEPIPAALTVGSVVRMTGNLNSSNQLINISVDPDPYRRTIFCGGVRSITPGGEPVSAFINSALQCNTSIGRLTFEGPTIGLAPSLNLPGVLASSNQCFSLVLDQFNLATTGTTVIPGNGNRLCGSVTGFAAATPLTPGAIQIGGVTVGIAAGVTLTGQNLVTSGANICLTPVFDTVGSNFVGESGLAPPPPRAGDLLSGSVVVSQ